MASKPFGEDIWKALQSVRADGKNGIQAPVTANGEDGITVGGIDASDGKSARPVARPGLLTRVVARVRRH